MSDDIVTTNDEEGTEVCAYIIENSPLMYFGELYYDVDDKEKNRLIFKRALLKVLDIGDKSKTQEANWIKVPTAGKDSLVQIDTRIIRGILVKNIDQREIEEYNRASLKLYSKLHVL